MTLYSHGGGDQLCGRLECDAVEFGIYVALFWKNLQSPSPTVQLETAVTVETLVFIYKSTELLRDGNFASSHFILYVWLRGEGRGGGAWRQTF